MKVVTFGESLFRTVSPVGVRLSQATRLDFYLGGSELNVAANLQSLGIASEWVSALPSGSTGELIKHKVKDLGVDISHCAQLTNGQVGWYLMESGAAPRPDIVFHRNASAMAKEQTFAFNWDAILEGAALFHTSGITTGLSQTLTSEVKKAINMAKHKNILVSYDLNYRKNIWSLDEFVSRQQELFDKIDILFCSKADLDLFFGSLSEKDNYANVFSNSKITYLIMTQRNADDSEYGIDVVSKNERLSSQKYKVHRVDRIGVGDSAAAGFIKAYLSTQDPEQACNWAALAGALKYGIRGDMALIKESELKKFFELQYSGIIR